MEEDSCRRGSVAFECSLSFEQPYEGPPPPAHRRDHTAGRVARTERPGPAADRPCAGGSGGAIVQLRGGKCVQKHTVAPLQGAARGGGDPYAGKRDPSARLDTPR